MLSDQLSDGRIAGVPVTEKRIPVIVFSTKRGTGVVR
jgi:hypothetical protein